ncbi:MAG: ABC transporter permease subunit [Deltaproteobacteria bacterium]|nr:ABC transporter permease subunit [Deltaproteobacteria bacterium]
MSFLTLLRKELYAYFVSPLFYVVAAVFLGLCGFFFYTRLIFFVEYGLGENILGNFWLAFMAGAPYSISMVLLLVMPLLTMRSFAEEKKLGTIELLLTYPIRDGELFCAKFTACVLVFVVLLAGTLVYPLYLYSLQPLPLGAVAAGYLGLLLLGLSFIACGVLISSLTDNQVVAAVSTLGLLLGFWVLTWNEAATSPGLLRVLIHLSMFDHFEPFARGTIDADHVGYFVFFVLFCSFLTLRVLEARTWRGRR